MADMIVPKTARDDFNQEATATTTLLRYELDLGWEEDATGGRISILGERLNQLPRSRAKDIIGFHFSKKWAHEVLIGKRNVPYFSTAKNDQGLLVIKRHQDGGSSGKPQPVLASTLPRTLLSRSDAFEAPTALCARREMESWIQLQLEPSSLRLADSFSASSAISPSGAHLPATLYRLTTSPGADADALLQRLTNRVRELVPEIRHLSVERDDKRELFTLKATLRDNTECEARSLSDGTLRFLALTVLEADPAFQGVVCFEEPENGIHPERVPSIIRLLEEIAVNPGEKADETNPLRQVIINTHSPAVVLQVPDSSLLIARGVDDLSSSPSSRSLQIVCLENTWRSETDDESPMHSISLGALQGYFNPIEEQNDGAENRVIDREGAQLLFSSNHGF